MPLRPDNDKDTTMWPSFTDVQVAFLEGMFPPKCMLPGDDPAAHLHYAGKVALIELLRSRTPRMGATEDSGFTEDELEDAEMARLEEEAMRAINNGIQEE